MGSHPTVKTVGFPALNFVRRKYLPIGTLILLENGRRTVSLVCQTQRREKKGETSMDTITQPLPKTSTTKDSRAVEPSAGDDSDVLYIVAPAYNVEETIRQFVEGWYPVVTRHPGNGKSRLTIVNDGSRQYVCPAHGAEGNKTLSHRPHTFSASRPFPFLRLRFILVPHEARPSVGLPVRLFPPCLSPALSVFLSFLFSSGFRSVCVLARSGRTVRRRDRRDQRISSRYSSASA